MLFNFLPWFVLITCTVLSLFLVYSSSPRITVTQNSENSDRCTRKYIYIQQLPPQFNDDLLANCSTLNKWLNMCDIVINSGLGSTMSNSGWFETNQFSLEVIFRNRMKRYECLTNDSSKASAVYVPFYAGLEAGRYLWNSDTMLRDKFPLELVEYLKGKPEWKKMWGRDHFFVAGRVTWDFRRLQDKYSEWGNCLFDLPEVKNMTSLVIESSPWSKTDFAIPYPSYFHPSSDKEVHNWQKKMQSHQRRYLFSFAGAPRPQLQGSIRNEIISQCINSKKYGKFLRCDPNTKNCDHPSTLMSLFQKSVFCLQPQGDSFTRRSTFDSILAGCIPVFFHPGSSYVQYLWHLPRNYTNYSVFIPMEDVKNANSTIEKRLKVIPKEEVIATRNNVIRLIPRVIYANPESRLESFKDAFDIAVSSVLHRIEHDDSIMKDFPEESAWKYNLPGGMENHEWDSYFKRT